MGFDTGSVVKDINSFLFFASLPHRAKMYD